MLGRWYQTKTQVDGDELPFQYCITTNVDKGGVMEIAWKWADGREPTEEELVEFDAELSEAAFEHYKTESGDYQSQQP